MRADVEENHLAFVEILYAGELMAPLWRLFLRSYRLLLVFGSDEKIMCIRRQLRDLARIVQRRFDVEEDRLIIRIHRVKRLACGNDGVDLCGGLFYLLPVSQNERGERITYSTDHESKPDETRDHLCPNSLPSQSKFMRPIQGIVGIAHREQP